MIRQNINDHETGRKLTITEVMMSNGSEQSERKARESDGENAGVSLLILLVKSFNLFRLTFNRRRTLSKPSLNILKPISVFMTAIY